MKKLTGLFAILLLLSACAHHRDVRPGEDVHKVVIATDDKEEGARDAIRQANHFCKESGQRAAFIQEDQTYTGDLDEKSYNNAKRASNVAKAVGGTVWVFGGKTERNVGGIVGLGGAAADAALGKGYTVEMRFKCK